MFNALTKWLLARSQEDVEAGPIGVLGYLGVRRAIGWLGIALPLVLIAGGALIDHDAIRSSISSYYYSNSMRGVLVGTLFAISVFLLVYRYKKLDDYAGTIACVAGIVTALFPTNSDGVPMDTISWIHRIASSMFLLALTFIALFVFTLTDQPAPGHTRKSSDPAKNRRNKVYIGCGVVMLGALGVALMSGLTGVGGSSLFWCELVAVEAFGVSWMIKGEALLGLVGKGPKGRSQVPPLGNSGLQKLESRTKNHSRAVESPGRR